MVKLWTISPHYIDDEMLLEVYFEGLRLLSLYEGQDFQNKEERRYYSYYFMYELLKTHPQKENFLARYLFEVSEVLKWQRGIEVDITPIVHRQTRTVVGQTPLMLTVTSQQIAAERETLKLRLSRIHNPGNIKPLPDELGLVIAHPTISVIPGEITVSAREQICMYVDTDRHRKAPYCYTRIPPTC